MTLVLSVALSVAALTGCKSAPKPAGVAKAVSHPRTEVERQLASMMGADLNAAIGILGFPDEKRQMSTGVLVYVWTTGRSSRLPVSEVRMGSYADQSGGGGPCKIELTADDHGRVAGYTWSGTDQLCAWVSRAFNRAEFEDESRQMKQ